MSFHGCVPESMTAFNYIPENEQFEDEEEDQTEVENMTSEEAVEIAQPAEETSEMDRLVEDFGQLEIAFHMFPLCFNSAMPDVDEIKINIKEGDKFDKREDEQVEKYNGNKEESTPQELSIGLFEVEAYNGISDTDEEDNKGATLFEATCLQNRSLARKPRRRAKVTPQVRANYNTQWEEQLASIEDKKEADQIQKVISELDHSPDPSQPTQPTQDEFGNELSLAKRWNLNRPIPKPFVSHCDGEFIGEPPPHLKVLQSFKVPIRSEWNILTRALHDKTYPFMFPAQPPNKIGQFLYSFNINGHDITTLLDYGASHSFLTRDWVADKGFDLTPIRPARPVGIFSGQKNYIRQVATKLRIRFGDHIRYWKFYIIDSAPYSAILGADAIMAWPIFFSPLDYRIFIIPELFLAKRQVGDLGGVYQYWHRRDETARSNHIMQQIYNTDIDTALLYDRSPTTSEDESYRTQHAPVPICYINMEQEQNLCAPWHVDKTPTIWLHAIDGLSSDSECEEENLLQLHTVTASSPEEAEELEKFLNPV